MHVMFLEEVFTTKQTLWKPMCYRWMCIENKGLSYMYHYTTVLRFKKVIHTIHPNLDDCQITEQDYQDIISLIWNID